jgi:sugar diacid utilization regulator
VELQQLQNALTTPDRNNLVAIVSLTEMVVLKPALKPSATRKRSCPFSFILAISCSTRRT